MKLTSDRNTLPVLIFSALAVLTWVGFEIARSYYVGHTPEVVEKQIRALNPAINTKALTQLSQRLVIPEDQLTAIIRSGIAVADTNKEATAAAEATASGR